MEDSAKILRELGYEFYTLEEEAVRPELSDTTFKDLLPSLEGSGLEISEKRLFKHQQDSYLALSEGKNLILKSGTGSGKTEAWFTYVAKHRVKTIAVYPTLALSNDQVLRLRRYCEALGLSAAIIDAPTRRRYSAEGGGRVLRRSLASSDMVITNPAFLLSELKKLGSDRPPLLREFLSSAGLMVVDDLDFYSPRSMAILMAMCKIVKNRLSPMLRFCFLTAMLENPEDLASFLTSLNGRETAIIEGKPFHPRNVTFIVLGRDLRSIWEKIRARRGEILRIGVGQDVAGALDSYESFLKNLYKVLEAARAAGISLEGLSPRPDPAELLARYARDNTVSIVFTRSIARAEELRRRVAEIVGEQRVASHHHLVSKEAREIIEQRARKGELGLVISPRTLSQGIDIGLVRRIVHIGLPDSLREFLQKEGRKGRRETIDRTESIIIPQVSWDYGLLRRGTEAFLKWLTMQREKVVINPRNKYITLVEALFKATRPGGVRELEPAESALLSSLGLMRNYVLTPQGKRAWMKMNFYEFAPSLGVKRIRRRRDGSETYLEDIAHVDLVERFQIGCIDYSSDGIVTVHSKSPQSSRLVTSVLVEDISESVLRRYEGLSLALEEYEAVKRKWGETPSLFSDYASGKLHSEVDCLVKPPEGFGLYVKLPNHIDWIVASGRLDVYTVDGKTIVSPRRRVLPIPTPTNGYYTDYTYGTVVESEPGDDPSMLRLGMALVEIVLRRSLGIPFETIKYDVVVVGDRRFVSIHEPEAAALIESLDWLELKRLVEEYRPDELDDFLLESINEMAYATLMSRGFDWGAAKFYACKVLEKLLLRERIVLKLPLGEILVPRPNRGLKLCSLAANYFDLDETGSFTLYCVGVFDGERFRGSYGLKTPEGPDNAYIEASSILSGLIDEGFRILIYGSKALGSTLERLGMKSLQAKLFGAASMGLVLDVDETWARLLGEHLPLTEASRAVGIERQHNHLEVAVRAASAEITPTNPYWIQRSRERIGPSVEKVTEEDARGIYMLQLVGEALKERERGAEASQASPGREPP